MTTDTATTAPGPSGSCQPIGVPPDLIRRVAIVGGGTAGWMAAAALSRVLGSTPGLSFQLVESDAIGTIGVGEATIPSINLFNTMLGIDEAAFVRETGATYKLGIEFVDWSRLGYSYIHPFGFHGIDMLGIEFHHHWLRGRAAGHAAPLEDFSIAAMAARAGKYTAPRPQQPNSPLGRLGYAFQFDAGRYARFLRGRAERQGVNRIEGRIVDIEQDPLSGHVRALTLDNGVRVEADLFIDCSGFRALLIGEALGIGFEDWSQWLPCDRAIAIPCTFPPGRDGGRDLPITRATARPAGWQWRIPLQHRIGNGHVYSSAFMSDDEALALLLASLDGEPLAEPNRIRFTTGHRQRFWDRNVVALGLAGGFLEPLESTAIHLVQAGIARLLAYWPTRIFSQPEIDRFNFETARDYADIRDFLILHYKATTRRDSAFWDYCRELAPPPGLAEKLAVFRSSGRIVREQYELFTETSWVAVMAGQEIAAGGYHPAAHALPEAETLNRLSHIRALIAETVASMPDQAEFLRQTGAASA